MNKPPETIYLIAGSDPDELLWCDDPDPSNDHDPADAIEYVRADKVDELRAQVERLRQAGNRVVLYRDPEEDWLQAVSKTPPQSLAAVRVDAVGPAIRTALRNFGNADIDEEDIQHFAEDYAQRIRTGEV